MATLKQCDRCKSIVSPEKIEVDLQIKVEDEDINFNKELCYICRKHLDIFLINREPTPIAIQGINHG